MWYFPSHLENTLKWKDRLASCHTKFKASELIFVLNSIKKASLSMFLYEVNLQGG